MQLNMKNVHSEPLIEKTTSTPMLPNLCLFRKVVSGRPLSAG